MKKIMVEYDGEQQLITIDDMSFDYKAVYIDWFEGVKEHVSEVIGIPEVIIDLTHTPARWYHPGADGIWRADK